MIKFLKVPKTQFSDYYQSASFQLSWRICILFAVVIGVITSISYLSEDKFFPYYAIVMSLVVVSLVYMKLTGYYRIILIFLFLGTTIAIAFAVFGIRNVTHTIEILWMIVIALAAFFILNRFWGYFFLFANCIIYVTYFNTYFQENLKNIEQVTKMQWTIMSVEFVFAMVLIALILLEYFKLNEYAIQKRKEAFDELNREKKLVDVQHKEKIVLLQEIHHRVKNNLQVIISLLRIHSQEMKSVEAKQAFQDAINRILTMSLIHQKMYEKDQLANINIEDYFKTLMDEILSSIVTKGDIRLDLDIKTESIGSKTIVPLALVVNELVTNSIKHGVYDGGTIRLRISREKDGIFEMEYADSGIWKEPIGSSLGIQLIDIFTDQLEGKYIRTASKEGTVYQFVFNDLDNVSNREINEQC